MGVSKLPHKTCPFSLQVSVYPSLDQSLDRSVNRSVHPTCLRYRSPLHVRSEQIGMENRSDFIPTPEFLESQKSEFRSREIFQLGQARGPRSAASIAFEYKT